MKSCPTSNMIKSKFCGFEVGHIVGAFSVLAFTNVVLNIMGLPLILSWGFGVTTLVVLRVLSSGQKEGHLELMAKYITEPHIYIGHKERRKSL
jgi:hypothetical protein